MTFGGLTGLGQNASQNRVSTGGAAPANGAAPNEAANTSAADAAGLSNDNVVQNFDDTQKGETVKDKQFGKPCQTCKERTYQDGSNDPGVSFKSAAHIDPNVAASVVMGHEQEHVSHEQSKAKSEKREVISQNVVLHTGVCSECGRTYIAGGTTTTVTGKRAEQPDAAQENLWPGSGVGEPDLTQAGLFMDQNS